MNVLIVGCGRVGSRLAVDLLHRGNSVTIIDQDATALERLGTHLNICRIHGDAGNQDVLVRGGIRDADGMALVTGNDELNAVIGRLAMSVFRVPRVVARTFDPSKMEIYRRLGVQTIAPITWGVRRLAELLTLSELSPVTTLGTGDVELVDIAVPALLAGRAMTEFVIPGETDVVAITREGHTRLSPAPSMSLQVGDVVHVAVTSTARLEALLSHR